jgi:hypothetical protein
VDPNELIKAAPQLAKGAAAISAAVPFTAIVKRMLGPAADELAEMLRDQVRLYRYERQIKCLEKAEQMARDAGFTPQAVPAKILFPLLEGASFEDNEDLHTMWAALLANAASTRNADKVRPSFIALLRQMAPDEAVMLNWMVREAGLFGFVRASDATSAYERLGFAPPPAETNDGPEPALERTHKIMDDADTCLSTLEVHRLIERSIRTSIKDKTTFAMTNRGWQFFAATHLPKSKGNG